MNIAILGTGKVGSALGAGLVSAGHHVVHGSRNPAGAPGTLDRREAVASAEVVVTAVPGTALLSTLEEIGDDLLGERIVLDPSAALTPQRTLASYGDSIARQAQARFPRARVVKALNTMNHTIMVDPRASLPQATVFVSGDDRAAKRTVNGLLVDLGWPEDWILDLGDIGTALATEHAAPLFFATAMALKTPMFNIAVSR